MTNLNIHNKDWVEKGMVTTTLDLTHITRTTHAHDALRRAVPVCIAHADRPPCGTEMSEIGQSSRTTYSLRLNRA